MSKAAISPARQTITSAQYRDANVAYVIFAHRVCERLETEHKHLLFEVNETIALNVVVATYDDIDRYKAYHLRNAGPKGSARADSVKRAAYFTKWTTKLRPISFKAKGVPQSDPDDMALMGNETLAAAYAIELIGSELNKSLKYSSKVLAELLYDLHYRDLNDDALLTIFQMVRDLANDAKPNILLEIGVI